MARPEPDNAERREPMGVNLRAVVWTVTGTAGFLLISLAGVWMFWQAGHGPHSFPLPRAYGPPALQSDPPGDLRDYLAAQHAARDGYAWLDRERGLVRIPVSRAMEILATRGEAAWAPPAPTAEDARR